MRSELFFRRQLSPWFFYCATRFIAFVVPERLWYPTVFLISRLQALLLGAVIGLTPYRRDARRRMILGWLMHAWLRELVVFGRPFPIPLRTKGKEAVLEAAANPNGMVICSVHLPLVNLILRGLVDMGRAPTAVVSGMTVLRNGESPLWGMREGLPVINTDGYVLNKVRHVLQRGGSVFALVDTSQYRSLNPNMLRLVRAVRGQVVFAITELQENGDIQVEFFAPPDPFCSSEMTIEDNLTALRTRIDGVLQSPPEHQIGTSAPVREITSAKAKAVELSEFDSSF